MERPHSSSGDLPALVASLCERFPEDEVELLHALEVLQKQRITTCERAHKLAESHWQRLGLPLGIEALLREEVAFVQEAACLQENEAEGPAPGGRRRSSNGNAPNSNSNNCNGNASNINSNNGNTNSHTNSSNGNSRASLDGRSSRSGETAAGFSQSSSRHRSAPTSGQKAAACSQSSRAEQQSEKLPSIGRGGKDEEEDDDVDASDSEEGDDEDEKDEQGSIEIEEEDDAALPLEDSDLETEGLRRRGGRGAGSANGRASGAASSLPSQHKASSSSRSKRRNYDDLHAWQPPQDLEAMWKNLLEESLPEDKRPPLQETWEATKGTHDKYMLYLEYSSYLRKPQASDEDREERRKQLEPLLREFGLEASDLQDSPEESYATLWWCFFGLIFFISALVYYTHSKPKVLHDVETF